MSSITAFGHCHVDRANRKMIINWHDSFQPNNMQSTFGFHTALTVPERTRKRVIPIHPDDLKQPDDVQIQACKASKLAFQLNASKSNAVALNILNILGYAPVLGLFPCVVRLIMPLIDKNSSMREEPRKIRTLHFIRGAIEGIGLGILYLIPDLIVSVKRFSK